MHLRIVFFISTFASLAWGGPPLLDGGKVADAPIKLVEAFSSEENPGKGNLVYKAGDRTESIALGAKGGSYGFGMIFHSGSLPEAFREDLAKLHIIQIALGTLKTHLTNQVPQFSSLMLISQKMPTQPRTFRATLPKKGAALEGQALVLFSSPQTPNERSDEEKLRGTYFSKAGIVTLTPLRSIETVNIKAQGRHFLFRTQTMRADFNAELGTPFNTDRANLKGSIEFPVYWPYGKESELFTKRIAADSLAGAINPIRIPEGISHHGRDVAGSQKKAKQKTPDKAP